jgi:alpha-tubulin suppressor-like RCC1 family protein
MNRRQALTLLAAFPLAARVKAQTRPGPQHRVILGGQGMLLEPGGTLKVWLTQERSDGLAPDWLGLGHNEPIHAFTLTPVPALSNIVAAAAGTGCSFAVLGDGRLLAWGWNSNGMLGTTPLSQVEATASWGPSSNRPVSLAIQFDAVSVSSQDSHVLALARDGSVYAWGVGKSGQLGIGPLPVINFKTHTPGPMTYVPFPVRIPALNDVTAISAGRTHSLALMKDGTVRAWGSNKLGEVGDGTTVDRNTPVPVLGVRNAIAVAAGGMFSLALLADGTVMTLGAKDYAGAPGPVPAVVAGARGIRTIAAGLAHAAGITDTGSVITWGDNTYYQLGRGRNAPSTPTVVKGLTGVQSIAAHNGSTTAVLSSGRIMTWGAVRPWTRPDGGDPIYSPFPILLWVDGLDQS